MLSAHQRASVNENNIMKTHLSVENEQVDRRKVLFNNSLMIF